MFSVKCISRRWALLLISCTAMLSFTSADPDVNEPGCLALKGKFSQETFEPASSNYTYEATNFWSNTTILSPQCIVAPSTSQEMSEVLLMLRQTQTKFAVRAIGHMPNPGFNSINDGVLIVLTNLRNIELASDQSSVSFGPGLMASELYEYLDSYQLISPLARYGPVGISGFLLGGGINHFGSQYGWAVNNVLEYEVVVANGSIVTANSDEHSDLFWALKGGGNNYGIVTKYVTKTYVMPSVYVGTAQWDASNLDAMKNAVQSFSVEGGGIEDRGAAINPYWSVYPTTNVVNGSSVLFHSGSESAPASLINFTSTANSNTAHLRSYFDYMAETVAIASGRVRDSFQSVGLTADPAAIELALNITISNAMAMLNDVDNAFLGLCPQPLSQSWFQAAIDSGGDAIGIDPRKGNLVSYLISVEWTDANDDDKVKAFMETTTDEIVRETKAKNLYYPSIYLNDAGPLQDPFQFYGSGTSLARMKSIRNLYDPDGVFQSLMPGGFKLGT